MHLGFLRLPALVGLTLSLGALAAPGAPQTGGFLFNAILGLSIGTLVLARISAKVSRDYIRGTDPLPLRVLVIGSFSEARPYLQLLKAEFPTDIVVGFVTADGSGRFMMNGAPIAPGLHEFGEFLATSVVDEVIVVSSHPNIDSERLATLCAVHGTAFRTLVQIPAVVEAAQLQHPEKSAARGDYMLLSADHVTRSEFAANAKRAIDIVGALVGLMLFALAYLWYARRIQEQSVGSVFFKQKRVGRNGRIFDCYKFRTMMCDAESHQGKMCAKSALGSAYIKIKNDPRVTPIGAALRRYHIDELPQFWNVLKGDMSLVGPRPSQPVEVAQYTVSQLRRLVVKPGLTGMFQIHGHEHVDSFDEVVRLDCEYIDRWSLLLDLKLIARTFLEIAKGSGI